jgi:predicted MFS family arabinose efflux permease
MIPFFTDWGRISFTEIMILQIWFAAMMIVLEVPTGTVADYFGRKASVMLGAIIASAGHFVYASMPNFWVFALAEFLLAAGLSLISGAEDALLYDSLKEAGRETESQKFFGRKRCFGLAGMMIAVPLGSIIGGRFGLRAPMMAEAVFNFFDFLLVSGYYEPRTESPGRRGYGLLMMDGLKHLARHPILRTLSLNGVLVFAFSFILVWLNQPALRSFGVDLKFFGFFHLILSVSQIIATNYFARLEKLAGSRKNYWSFCVLSSAVAFVVLAFSGNIIIAGCCFAVISGFGISRWAFDQNYMQKHIESYNRATVLSAVSMMRSMAKIACYAAAGILMLASLMATFIFFGVALVVLAVFSGIRERHLED